MDGVKVATTVLHCSRSLRVCILLFIYRQMEFNYLSRIVLFGALLELVKEYLLKRIYLLIILSGFGWNWGLVCISNSKGS